MMSEWISTKDRMPEDGKEVLFYGEMSFMVGGYDADEDYWVLTDADTIAYPESITHWMELPERPDNDDRKEYI